MRRKAMRVSIVLAVIFIIAFFYINNVFLPVQFRRIVIDKTQQFFGREVTVGEIICNPFQGCHIHNLTIYEKDSRFDPFIDVKEFGFNILLPPILKNQKIIIPKIVLTKPKANITKFDEDTYNFTDIIDKIRAQSKSNEKSPQFLIGSVQIDNGKIIYLDTSRDEPISEIFEKTNFSIKLSLSKAVRFYLETVIPKTKSSLLIKGEYDIPTRVLTSDTQITNIDIVKIYDLVDKDFNFKINNGHLKSTTLKTTYQNKKLEVVGDFDISSFGVEIDGGLEAQGNASTDLFTFTRQEENWTLGGNFNFGDTLLLWDIDKEFKGSIETQNTRLEVSKLKTEMNSEINIKNAQMTLPKTKIKRATLSSENTYLVYENNILNLISQFQMKDTKVSVNETQEFFGDPAVSLKLTLDESKEPALAYSGTITLANGSVTGLPVVNDIKKAKGIIQLAGDQLKTEELKFSAFDTDITLDGQVSELANPLFDINFTTTDLNLKVLNQIVEEPFKKADITTNGRGFVKGSYKGNFSKPKEADMSITATLKDANLRFNAANQELSQLNGEINYVPNLVSWKNVTGQFLNKDYNLDGSMSFEKVKPYLESTIKSENIDVLAQLHFLNNAIQFTSIVGKIYGNDITIKGDGRFPEEEPPLLNLKTDATLDLQTLQQIVPKAQKHLEKINPQGTITLESKFKGDPNNWREWQLLITAKSPKVSAYGFDFDQVNLQFEQSDLFVNQLTFSGLTYDGRFNISSTANLKPEEIPFELQAALQDSKLELIKKNLPISDKKLSGKISSHLLLSGDIESIKNIKGEGKIIISGGHLWKFSLFKGLLQLLVIPEYENIVFTDAATSFTIENQKLKTNNLTINSAALDLVGSGWIDFDKTIDFHISPRVKEISIIQSEATVKAPTSILTSMDNYVAIRVSGSLDEPKYTLESEPKKIIENATDVLIEGLSDIFEGIF